ncbi:MAG: hypothetical protein ACFHWZ_09510 [Phycisphaerales bacterium]
MNGMSPRRWALLGVLVVLGIAVAVDRGGLIATDASPSPGQRYALVQAQLAQQRQLLDDAGHLREEVETLRELWSQLRPRLIQARTAELAPASVRDRMREVLARAGVARVRVLSEEVRAGEGTARTSPGSSVVPVRIRVSFDVPDSELVYAAIAAIDSASDLHARVVGASIRGGGLNEAAGSVNVTLTIDTAVVIGGGGS